MENYNSIIILGPTGSGKTNISLKIAKKLNGEIINADSMQIYKDLDIGTAKVTKDEQKLIKHHLIDIVSPFSEFSVSDYRDLALEKCKELIDKNIIPIIVGGTGFYIQSLTSNFTYGDKKDDEYRKELENLVSKEGSNYIFSMLRQIDPESAQKLHPNDIKRVIRALEIYKTTGKTKSEIEKLDREKSSSQNFLNPLIIGLNCERKVLYNRLNLRVDQMVKDGLVNEVESCFKNGLTIDNQSMNGIGYKELLDYFNQKCTLPYIDEAVKASCV